MKTTRRIIQRLIEFAAGFVYQRGVNLYRLADWVDPDWPDKSQSPVPQPIVGEPHTYTYSDAVSVTWHQQS